MLDGERNVVAAFADAIAAVRPELRGAGLDKPLTMLLFGMINWMFTWLQPDGALTHADMAPSSPTCSSAACGAVQRAALRRVPIPSNPPQRRHRMNLPQNPCPRSPFGLAAAATLASADINVGVTRVGHRPGRVARHPGEEHRSR